MSSCPRVDLLHRRAFRPPRSSAVCGAAAGAFALARLVLLPFVSDVNFLQLHHILLIAQSKPSNLTLGQACVLLHDVCD
jgi:hypothetical protein